ncbi:phosphotransferase enzyme family protein [Enterococcus sp. LJL90]
MIDSSNPAEFNIQLFKKLGAVMGEMHHLTQEYPKNQENLRFAWNGPLTWRKQIAILDEAVSRREVELIQELAALPKDNRTYGIVHFDIHLENFLVDQQQLTLIDFDACQFNWYAADIASTLFFMVQAVAGPLKGLSEEQRQNFAEKYLIAYLKGYLKKNQLTPRELKQIDLFMKYQMVDEYVAAQTFGQNDDQAEQQWYLQWFKDRIVADLPYVQIDFDRVISEVFAE